LEIFEYVVTQGCPWDGNLTKTAAEIGSLKLLEYAYQHQEGTITKDIVTLLVRKGYLDCLEYLHEQNVEWHDDYISTATFCGQVGCLKFLHEHGCPWPSKFVLFCVGLMQNLPPSHASLVDEINECMMYAVGNDCPLM